nr:relaxase/mobilization nuclease domain-containing protein [Streptococcus gordonii]
MVVTKHFAIHGKNYRSKLIKYILNPSKTKNLTLVSDFGMRNYLDFPSYKELVKMYNDNFLSNDTLYEIRHDRQEANQRKIHSHHIIQSFSPDDHLTPEQINQIGYETVKELTGGRFRFIVATHVDKDHIHNHIILNSIDKNSDKKFLWDYKAERNLRMVSDRLSKIVGAKIIENRYSHHQYEVYRKTNYKYEIKQRVYFLIENSKNFEDFKKKAKALHLKIDFRHKHVTINNSFLTFREFMEEIYLKYYQQKVQFVTYQTALPHHQLFIKQFGSKKLSDISTIDCERFRLAIIDKYSSNYAKNMWSRFKACLGYAERLGYIDRVPFKGLDNPRGKHPDTKFWTFDEFKKVINSFDISEYEGLHNYMTIWLYFMTGLRVSEGIALKWEDIDFERKWIHVHSTIEKDKNGVWYAKQQTKTVAGNRKIDLDDFTITILKKWREVQIKNDDKDYVISRFGAPLCKSTISRIIKRHARVAGVPEITGKGLRHSHASYLINVLHKDTLYVSYRLGHADKSTTLNTYSHWYYSGDSTISEEITDSLDNLGLSIYLPNSCQS